MCEPITSENSNKENTDLDVSTEISPVNDVTNEALKDKSASNLKDPYDFFSQNRQVLPGRIVNRRFSIWSIIREFVGRDLTRITLPITMNEPLSLLHKVPEFLGRPELITNMVQAPNPVERIECIAAFFAVAQASQSYRSFKPFNPLLGETFELNKPEKDLLFVTEQISHHPPITAFYSQMHKWRVYGSFQPWIKFSGNSIDSVLNGTFTYEFLDSKGCVETVITIVPPVTTLRNIILGKYGK